MDSGFFRLINAKKYFFRIWLLAFARKIMALPESGGLQPPGSYAYGGQPGTLLASHIHIHTYHGHATVTGLSGATFSAPAFSEPQSCQFTTKSRSTAVRLVL